MAFPGKKLESPLQLSQLFTNKIPGNYLGIASLAAAVFGDDGLDAFDEIATVDHGAGRGNTDHAVHGSRLLDGRHGY